MAIHDDWKLIDDHHYEREWEFPDFVSALDFVNKVGNLCEELNHHAEMVLGWGKVLVRTWSHDIDGISARDLLLCERIDNLD
ncbi:MAG: 4a-hydroxytetrahydrobiopterin dehydratase [Candidatus Thermoplasmatota archaeon]|nr:4a-hydroxytetrahydrobiopterin dehydratase [Candidatus Thermoplasmatota archaeon]